MGISISGVILSGGENKRFGGITKSKIVIGDKTIILRMIEILEVIFDEIIIVTNTPDQFKEFNRHTITGDTFYKAGPLGGLHAAMRASTRDSIFTFAGDMPFINKEIIIGQIKKYSENKCEALVPQLPESIQPLHSIYSNSILNMLGEYLTETADYAVKDFLRRIDVHYLKMEGTYQILRAFTNINTPSDLDEMSTLGYPS